MNPILLYPRARLAALALAGALPFAGNVGAQAVQRPPNMIPLGASNLTLVVDSAGRNTLRFSTTSWNQGTGPLEVVAGEVDTGSGKLKVYQNISYSDGSSALHLAGSFQYHPEHEHMHFDDYAMYTLQPVNAPGGSARFGSKMTFCLMDTTRINSNLPGAPGVPVYSRCDRDLQGISVGWGDTYGAHLSGQSIDFTGNPDGIYQLRIEVDPKKLLVESNENDNISCVLVRITKPTTVSVLDSSGQCSSVSAISPNVGRMGTSVQVTISGYGFTAGTTVRFEGGNGPTPVASNVQLMSNTDSLDTLTALVTVPYKKKGGRDPLWDVRVGSGGVLRDGFRVAP